MWRPAISLLCLFIVMAAAKEAGSHGDCYHIDTGIMAAIIAGDFLFTLLLLIPVYYCSRRKGKEEKDTGDTRNYINMIGKHN